jgi:hypothetical protein
MLNHSISRIGVTDAARSATTDRDGGYELDGLVPGTLELRATKPGYEPTTLAVSLEPGDTHVSVLMHALIRRDGWLDEVGTKES